jgi:hypothetical protein
MEEENVFRKIIRENFALKRYKAQLNYLDRLHWHDEEVQSWIPYQVATPFSGIPVDGYAKSKKYVVLPQPHENSLSNFWDLVLQEKIEIILFLNESKCDIWPYSNRKYDSDVSVKAVDQICTNYCTTTELLLKYTTQTTNVRRTNVNKQNKYKTQIFADKLHTESLPFPIDALEFNRSGSAER